MFFLDVCFLVSSVINIVFSILIFVGICMMMLVILLISNMFSIKK